LPSATPSASDGADLATVRDTLGHASIATTSRYLHARPEKSSGDYLAV
jgi:integrase/recombinase XerD